MVTLKLADAPNVARLDHKQLILEQLDIEHECTQLGVEFVGRANPGGWRTCHAIDRDDKHPSAAVCVDRRVEAYGCYRDHGADESLKPFELLAKLNRLATWQDAVNHYADRLGIDRTSQHATPQTAALAESRSRKKTPVENPEPLPFRAGCERADPVMRDLYRRWMVTQWCNAKGGLAPDVLLASGVEAGGLYGHSVIAIPTFLPPEFSTPAGRVFLRIDGRPFDGHSGRAPAKKLNDRGADGFVVMGGESRWNSSAKLWLVEGESDAVSLAGVAPDDVAVVTTIKGAGGLTPELAQCLAGRVVTVCFDSDEAGEKGRAKAIRNLRDVAREIYSARLPGEIAKDHGQDLRDFIASGHGWDDVAALAEPAEKKSWLEDDENLSEIANARRLVERHGADIRWVESWQSWYVWDGCRWARDTTRQVQRFALESAEAMWQELPSGADETEIGKYVSYVRRSCSRAGVAAAVELAKAIPGIAIDASAFDAKLDLLNFINGTLDLSESATIRFRPNDRADLLTVAIQYGWDDAARCDNWERMIPQIFTGDVPLEDYVQQAVGLSLSGRTYEHACHMAVGEGSNGKGTFLGALLQAFGPYGAAASHNIFLKSANESHPTTLAHLANKRFVIVQETDQGARMNESLFKQMTGGDTVAVRRCREDFWEMTATYKIWLSTNYLPVIRGDDHGIWRRVKVVPFDAKFEGESVDPLLPQKLQAELPGIMAWAFRGWMRYRQTRKLLEPGRVRDAVAGYRRLSDTVQDFIDQRCRRTEGRKTTVKEMHESFIEFGGKLTQKELGDRLTRKEFVRLPNGGPKANLMAWQDVELADAPNIKIFDGKSAAYGDS